jgi:hypothetical protein
MNLQNGAAEEDAQYASNSSLFRRYLPGMPIGMPRTGFYIPYGQRYIFLCRRCDVNISDN